MDAILFTTVTMGKKTIKCPKGILEDIANSYAIITAVIKSCDAIHTPDAARRE